MFAGIASGAEGLFWNPAAVVWGQRRDLFGGFERPFGMSELETQAFGIVLEKGDHGLGMRYQKFGFALYLEQQVGLTYGHLFGQRLGLGVTVRGLEVRVAQRVTRRWAVFDLGVQAVLKKGVTWGLAAWNAGGTRMGVLGQGGMMGLGVEVGEGVVLVVDIQKESGMPTGSGVGLEYRLREGILLRVGAGGHPERVAAGMGVRKGWMQVDYAALFHTVLGVSHRVSMRFSR